MKHAEDIAQTPKLTLVGAGPGASDLITLRGLQVLKTADIVLFDALVSQEILEYIPAEIPTLSVGKRAGKHSLSQIEINKLIVESAFEYGHVVRLKGGDPFVFGRGYEEMQYAEEHGILTAVVPGISSVIAVPASINIPITSRTVSESFWVITGTTQSGAISNDVTLAAQSTATVVILMGLRKIKDIMQLFIDQGKQHTPVAVIQNGTLASERSIIATVLTIADAVTQDDIGSPAVIVIGEVVKYARVAESILQGNNYR